MRGWTCVVILCAAVSVSVVASEAREAEWLQVQTAQGAVRGRRDDAHALYEFYNIPYATAPTGENKFKAPLPPPTWTEPYDAIDKKIICPQFYAKAWMPGDLKQEENCLIANVFAPDTEKKNLSVLVYVHGGAFQVGYGNWLKYKNLMKNKDIIIVNFNFRVGIQGFLCLGTKDIPGNAGIKDQIALLRWVQQNIAAFGGNPKDITLAGYSAGSAAVDLLMISKSTEGLFHKVIPESGANLAAFAVQSDPLQIAKDHARTLNFTNIEDIYALEKFYKNLPTEILTADMFFNQTDCTFMFSPCVERDTGDGGFLTESPISILSKGDYRKVPLLYGFANMEGLIRVANFDMWKNKMNDNFADFLPADLKFGSEDERQAVAQQIKEFYFGEKPIDTDKVLAYVDYISDVMSTYPVLRAVKLHAEAGHDQVYLYEYSFVHTDIPVVPHTNIRGADHCSQTGAVVDGRSLWELNEDGLTEQYKKMKKITREIWHNFVKTGKPVPEGSSLPAWPAAGADRSPHMSLDEELQLRGVLLEERTRFWDDIYEKYYREPMPPPPPPKTREEL